MLKNCSLLARFLVLTPETEVWLRHWIAWVYLYLFFFVGSVKRIISARVRIDRSRSSKGHWLWQQSKARMRLPISRHRNVGPIFAPFLR